MLSVVLVLISYLLGSVSFSIIVGHMFGVEDIRKHGSGNAGSTNVLRTIGKKAAAITFICDVVKGVIPVLAGYFFFKDARLIHMTAAGLSVIVGHVFPVFYGFRGGKGIATSFGVVCALCPCTGKWWLPFVLFGIWLIVVLFSRMVSLASVTVMAVYPFIILFLFGSYDTRDQIIYVTFAVLVALLCIFKHKSNIIRIIKGTESKLGKK